MMFVCWLWRGRGFDKQVASYGPEHVVVLASMLRRHGGHDLTVVHDGTFAIGGDVRQIVMPSDVAAMPDYLPKLWAWSPEFHELIGERFASIDLDVVILDDLAPVLTGLFRIWDYAKLENCNTSLFVIEPGQHPEVWATLDLDGLRELKNTAPRWTGDQSWVSHVLGPSIPTFGEAEGIYCYRRTLHRKLPPPAAKALFFCGPFDPRVEAERSRWIEAAWR